MNMKRTIDLKNSTSKSTSIVEAAEDFVRQCVPGNAPPQQQADMMMAFMAGAFALYTIEMNPAFCVSDPKTMEGNMVRLVKEMEDFFAPMAGGPTNMNPSIKKDLGD